MYRRKLIYIFMGGVVAFIILLPAIAKGFKLDVPILPIPLPDKIEPTTTPSKLIDPPVLNAPIEAMDPISKPPVEADLSPELPSEEKASIVLQYPNGKRTQVFMSPDKVEEYLSSLLKGIMVVTIIPPASLVGHQPPTPDLNLLPKKDITIEGSEPSQITPPLPSYNNK